MGDCAVCTLATMALFIGRQWYRGIHGGLCRLAYFYTVRDEDCRSIPLGNN